MLRDPENAEPEFIRNVLGSSAGKVLEVGCGNGRLTGDLTGNTNYVLGLDTDRISIDKARLLHGGTIGFILGSGEQLPFLPGSFDLVLFSFSLHHQDPVRALGEARRVLKGDGRILILEPVEYSLVTMLFALLEDESAKYEQAEAAIRTSGLRTLRSGSFGSLWVFEDFRELIGYLFDYYHVAPDPIKVKGIEDLLGERQISEPLELKDITRYWLLYRGSSQGAA